jgi:molecular chaperone DnaK
VEEAVSKVRGVINSDDAGAIRRETDALMQVVQQIGAAAYQQSGPAAGAPGGGPQGPGGGQGPGGSGPEGEDVVDGEFRNA